MNKRGLRSAKRFFNAILVLIMLITFVALCLSVYCSINYQLELAKYIYALLGFVILPLEYFLTGTVSGKYQEQSASYICIIIEVIILIAVIFYLACASNAFKNKNSIAKRNFYSVMAIILQVLFLAVFVVSALVLIFKNAHITNSLNSFGPELIKKLTTTIGINIIVVKELVVVVWGFVASIFALIMFIMANAHKSTKVKIVSATTSFYSEDYEEPVHESKIKEENASEQQTESTYKHDPKAQELINKIMELDELKKQGKISNVDYTRLRQKVIRRYKK